MSWRSLALSTLLAGCVGAPSGPSLDRVPTKVIVPTSPSADASAPSTRAQQRDYWKLRTDEELDAAFEDVCARAEASGKPVLLTFSAEWCPDCKRMYTLAQKPTLGEELTHWEQLVINPGRLDRHEPVLQAFGVSRIVTWVAARPQDCRLPAPSWTRLREGAFEPATGQPWTETELATWLREARG